MQIEFITKKTAVEVTYKVWQAEWYGTPYSHRMEGFEDQRIIITWTGRAVGVEIFSTKTGELLAFIPSAEFENTPDWLQDLIKRTVELV